MNDEQIAERTEAFKMQYLLPLMLQLEQEKVDPFIVVFALMETVFELLQNNIATAEGAVDMFEELSATYLRNWKAKLDE